MFVKINLNGKEVEAFISESTPEADKIALSRKRGNSRDHIGDIRLYNNNEIFLTRDGEDMFGWRVKPVLDAEATKTVLDAREQAIKAKRGSYVESADERAEWHDDQHGHLLLKGRR